MTHADLFRRRRGAISAVVLAILAAILMATVMPVAAEEEDEFVLPVPHEKLSPLDPISVEALTEWIETGRSAFVDHINKQWRLRRDSGL